MPIELHDCILDNDRNTCWQRCLAAQTLWLDSLVVTPGKLLQTQDYHQHVRHEAQGLLPSYICIYVKAAY